ncbi:MULTISPECIES: hypothetical protein [unclassified Saccharicrinis]|uniref:hypothetical protein n=1 Tax=unclassified Saccharicrinis TaxID=2646859 RepID=UPI003D345DDB
MEKALELLHNRFRKIEERNFDLNSWKKGTIAVLDSVLGPENLKRKLIEDIEFENNSWSLRDTTGDVDSIKKTCADVLETIILEIETFGLAEKIEQKKEVDTGEVKIIEEAIRKELSQSQLEDLLELIQQKDVAYVDVVDKFKRYGYEVAPRILASLVMLPDFKKSL